MLAARMRDGATWSDANILNLSSRGLLLHAARPPARGTYIEVRRGGYVIIGRVIWAEANRFGVRAQDGLEIDSLISSGFPLRQPANDVTDGIQERRMSPRSEGLEWRYVRNRDNGRALQAIFVAVLGIMLSALLYDVAATTFSRPLSLVSLQLRSVR
jgi:hypothetical protein